MARGPALELPGLRPYDADLTVARPASSYLFFPLQLRMQRGVALRLRLATFTRLPGCFIRLAWTCLAILWHMLVSFRLP